jgi:hypothetical protein
MVGLRFISLSRESILKCSASAPWRFFRPRVRAERLSEVRAAKAGRWMRRLPSRFGLVAADLQLACRAEACGAAEAGKASEGWPAELKPAEQA